MMKYIKELVGLIGSEVAVRIMHGSCFFIFLEFFQINLAHLYKSYFFMNKFREILNISFFTRL